MAILQHVAQDNRPFYVRDHWKLDGKSYTTLHHLGGDPRYPDVEVLGGYLQMVRLGSQECPAGHLLKGLFRMGMMPAVGSQVEFTEQWATVLSK